MSALAVLQQRAFETGRFDVGNLTQVVWSTAHGRFLEMTDIHGDQISRLGAHFDPIVVALVPLWWLWPSPELLLVVQAVAVALGAVPVYLLARKHLGSDRAGLLFGAVYLLYPPTQWLVVDDFHPVALATPLLLGAIWFLDEERLSPFAVCAAAACLTKEQIGLVVAMLGLWFAFARGRRRGRCRDRGSRNRRSPCSPPRSSFRTSLPEEAPRSRGDTPRSAARPPGSSGGAIEHPVRLAQALTEHRDLAYLLDLLAPLGGLSLLSPLLARERRCRRSPSTSSPTRARRRPSTSTTRPARSPASSPRRCSGAAKRAATLAGRRPASRRRARRRRARSRGPPRPPAVLGARAVRLDARSATITWSRTTIGPPRASLQAIPAGVPVSATNTLGAHLSERRRIFSFPVVREARWIALDLTRPSYLDNGPGAGFPAAYERLQRDGRWRVGPPAKTGSSSSENGLDL